MPNTAKRPTISPNPPEPLPDREYTLADAAAQWGIAYPDNLRQRIARGTLHARKSGAIWLVSHTEMERVFGPKPAKP